MQNTKNRMSFSKEKQILIVCWCFSFIIILKLNFHIAHILFSRLLLWKIKKRISFLPFGDTWILCVWDNSLWCVDTLSAFIVIHWIKLLRHLCEYFLCFLCVHLLVRPKNWNASQNVQKKIIFLFLFSLYINGLIACSVFRCCYIVFFSVSTSV